jgi:hypothetical protein
MASKGWKYEYKHWTVFVNLIYTRYLVIPRLQNEKRDALLPVEGKEEVMNYRQNFLKNTSFVLTGLPSTY